MKLYFCGVANYSQKVFVLLKMMVEKKFGKVGQKWVEKTQLPTHFFFSQFPGLKIIDFLLLPTAHREKAIHAFLFSKEWGFCED